MNSLTPNLLPLQNENKLLEEQWKKQQKKKSKEEKDRKKYPKKEEDEKTQKFSMNGIELDLRPVIAILYGVKHLQSYVNDSMFFSQR